MPENKSLNDIKFYWAIFLRRKYTALSAAFIVLSLFTWGSYFMPKTYKASSIVFVERSSIINPLMKSSGSSGMEERLRNIKDGITTRNIIERVIKKLGLDAKSKNPAQLENLIDDIRKNLDVRVKGMKETDLFVISFQGGDPKTVRDVVNTLVGEYVEENLGYKRSDAYGAHEFVQSQLLEYKKKLDESDTALRELREKNPKMAVSSETTLLSRIENFQASQIEADILIKELSRKRDNIKKQLSGEKELTVSMVTKEGSPQARLNSLNNQLVILTSKYTDDYPEVIKTKREIEELKKQIEQGKDKTIDSTSSETATTNPIYQQLREELAKIEYQIESMKARSAELARQQASAQSTLGRMPKEQEELVKIARDRNVYQKIYDELLQKLESAKVSKDLELTDKNTTFRIVDPAVLPSIPDKPDRVIMILLGMVLGIGAGIGSIYGLEYFDHSFKDTDTVEAKLKLQVLATIPRIVTDSDELSEKQLNRKILIASGAYLSIIVLLLIREILFRYFGIIMFSY
jgi:polysaccharide chain length determinant protein (PEP-CTERM system associated)